ncbi:hypothetical protein F443_02113 [Phytophthora nicotianae P1569]|uniref:MULE transposase domain-containing protein n=1 Tax=Phytophthora nicotianae P1569 TaxID=1317065 RepID=V9FWN2_PHYNI|nr:hypothetical protein F443_02113 [Phytophthora nicotianae P1569]
MFDPTGDLNRAFCFGHNEDENGHAYVGKNTDSDSFVVGVSNLALIKHVSTTPLRGALRFSTQMPRYPIITCELSDSFRSYQLAAIFVVIRRTAKKHDMCLSALVAMVKRARPTSTLHIDAAMGDAEDAQLNWFQQVSPFVIQDAAMRSSTSDTTIQPPTGRAAKAVALMIAKDRATAYTTNNPATVV